MSETGKVSLHCGLPETLRPQAARLYWQAFGGKLGLVLGPEARALRFLERVIRGDHVIGCVADHPCTGHLEFLEGEEDGRGVGLGDAVFHAHHGTEEVFKPVP